VVNMARLRMISAAIAPYARRLEHERQLPGSRLANLSERNCILCSQKDFMPSQAEFRNWILGSADRERQKLPGVGPLIIISKENAEAAI